MSENLFHKVVIGVGGLCIALYGRPMERLAFRYDRHEEIARYFGCGMFTIIQW